MATSRGRRSRYTASTMRCLGFSPRRGRATRLHRLRQYAELDDPEVRSLVLDSRALGRPRCTSTASASIWRPRGARSTAATARAAFLRALRRTPPRLRASSSPSPGTSVPAATSSATSPPDGRSGTTATATPCARFWRGDRGTARGVRGTLRRQERPVSPAAAARPRPASISSPRTTASRSRTSCRYNAQHNEANGENNPDGRAHN